MHKMHRMRYILTFLLLFGFVLMMVQCSEEQPEVQSKYEVRKVVNPNGDSELALLMRDMLTDAKEMRAQIRDGELPVSTLAFEELLTAEATEPEKAASTEYKAYAEAHIQLMETIQSTDQDHSAEAYEDMVQNCMNCHRALCPGPTRVIKKLALNNHEE